LAPNEWLIRTWANPTRFNKIEKKKRKKKRKKKKERKNNLKEEKMASDGWARICLIYLSRWGAFIVRPTWAAPPGPPGPLEPSEPSEPPEPPEPPRPISVRRNCYVRLDRRPPSGRLNDGIEEDAFDLPGRIIQVAP